MNEQPYVGETSTIKLPNGIIHEGELISEITVREFGGDEERMLGSKNANAELIVCRCINQIGHITDPGVIYRDIYPNMKIGDFNRIMFEIRRLSLGNTFEYSAKCSSCSTVSKFELDLKDLEIVWATDPMATEWEYVMKSGAVVKMGPVLASLTPVFTDIKEAGVDLLRRITAARVISVNGEPVDGNNPMQRVKNAVKMLMKAGYKMGDGEGMRAIFKEDEPEFDSDGEEIRRSKEGNVDTVVWDSCPKCSSSWKHRLSLGFSFLFPSAEL